MATQGPQPPAATTVALQPWQRRVGAVAACTLPGVLVRFGGGVVPEPLALLLFGSSVLAAAFLLAWASEAAEVDISHGLVVAIVALVAIMPEYVVELYFAFTGQAEYVTANLTGASRMLLGFCVALPVVVSLLPTRWRPPRVGLVSLEPMQRVELAFLAAAALVALRSVFLGHLSWVDSVALISLYVLYLRRVTGSSGERPPLVGVAAQLAALPRADRRRWVGGILLFGAVVILLTAEPFANALLATGTRIGISPYLLVQWLVPVATEAPELVVAFVLMLHGRAGQSIAVLLSAAVSQYTLALGSLPIAFMLGRGSGPLPLAQREQVELFLTAGVALFAVAALISLRLRWLDAWIMLGLFATQFLLPTVWTRLAVAIVFMTLAADLLLAERRQLRSLAGVLVPAWQRD